MPESLTINSIAQMANVSKATVSRVLNNHSDVNAKTRENILRIIKETGYRPSPAAQRLTKKRTNNIGLIIPHTTKFLFTFPYYAEILIGIGNKANQYGYRLILATSISDSNASEGESTYTTMARDSFVEGIILFDVRIHDARIHDLKEAGMPFALVGRDPTRLGIHYVVSDNVHGAYMATEYLIMRRGHQRIGFINGEPTRTISQDRLQGYKLALEKHNIDFDDGLVLCGDSMQESGYKLAQELLKARKPPTAIFAAGDLMALGAIKAVRDAGLKVPQDVAIIGFDDIHLAAYSDPALTTVRQPIREMGEAVAEMLINIIKGEKKRVPLNVILPTELIIRESA